jgi:hypothetical protein
MFEEIGVELIFGLFRGMWWLVVRPDDRAARGEGLGGSGSTAGAEPPRELAPTIPAHLDPLWDREVDG